MLTFLLLSIACIALIHYALYWIYLFFIWFFLLVYNFCSITVTLALDKTNRPKPPKPPIPPKPVGYRPSDHPSNQHATTGVESQVSLDNHVPSIVVSNATECENVSPADNNNNTGHEDTRLTDSEQPTLNTLNGETTPKTIAPSAIASKATTDAVEAVKGNLHNIPKSVMAREESFDSVENDICCTNLASYFVHKAKAFAHPTPNKGKKVPPPKPPKPKKEDIERARKRFSSFGEEIPGGREGFRYFDDESTESSVDYKDVVFENGKILAINRLPKPPKSDSPEPVVEDCEYEPFEFYRRGVLSDDYELTEDPKIVSNVDQSYQPKDDIFKDFLNDTETNNNISESILPEDINQKPFVKSDNVSKSILPEDLNQKPFVQSDNVFNDQHLIQNKVSSESPVVCDRDKDATLTRESQLPSFMQDEDVTVITSHRSTELCTNTGPDIAATAILDDSQQVRLKFEKTESSQNVDCEGHVTPSNVRRSPSEERHSWPTRGKKTPPERPPPPRRKCLSLSDDDHVVKTEKIKPPRPPPPVSPASVRKITMENENPRPPPRRRSRSRTVEITAESIKPAFESTSYVRRCVSFNDHTRTKPEIKSMYSTIDTSKKQKVSDKMKFRPLPPPPPPPRSHSKRYSETTAIESQMFDRHDPSPDNAILMACDSERRETVDVIRRKPVKQSTPDLKAQIENIVADENANLPVPTSQSSFLSYHSSDITLDKRKDDRLDVSDSPRQYASSTFYCDNLNTSCALPENRSKSPSPIVMRSRISTSQLSDGTESEVSGINADVDSSANSSRQVSIERTFSKSKKGDRTSVFYYDIPPEVKQCMEKSVQTSPDYSSCQVTDKGEDSDELMDIANDIRRELNSILQRRRNVGSADSDLPSSQDELPVQGIVRGGPGSSRSSEVSWQESSDESDIEPDGTPVMISPEQKKLNKLRFIANELMSSESTFVDALRLLNVDFLNAVHKSTAERGTPIVPDEVMNHIFRYLPQLLHLNENLLQEIKMRTDNWNSHQKISDVIVKVGPFLKLYSSYIREFESVTVMLDEACRKYPHFAQVVKDFEASSVCQKLALKHFLLKPVQRIPQYRLLLEDYLHNLTPDSVDYNDTVKALQIVSEVANHANETMKQGDNFLKLVSIQNSLLTRHEIVKPGRVFLKEGELLKLSRRVMQSRWFILFNDSLLYLTPVQQGLYRINHELPLTGMRVSVPMQTEYRNEFSVISVTRSFSLAAKSSEERDEWITDLTRAIEENTVKRSSFVNMQQKGKASFHLPDTALGKQAPVWIPDSRVTMCQLCTTEFTITYRRHHCRGCGRVVCNPCSLNKAKLHYLDNQIARVCDVCFEKLSEDYDRDTKTLSSSSLDQRTTDSEVEASRFTGPPGYRASKMAGKKSHLPSVLKERSKPDARNSPTPFSWVRANDQGSDISGHLFMLNRRAWKRFWFVVKDKVLYTYKASEDVAAKKSLPLLGFNVETTTMPHHGIDPNLIFMLKHPGQSNIVFHAESVGFAERWVKAMRNATVL